MQTPLVSVIVPAYNQAEYLPDALASVLNQTYSNWECIIVNDGSSDHTSQVAEEWCRKDHRFRFISLQNGGVSNARNTAISIASGFYILPLDGDDKISDNYIDELVKIMNERPDVKVCYGQGEKFGIVSGVWNVAEYSLENLILSNMIHCSGLFRKTDFDAVGGYDIKMHDGLEDWEFWINLLKNGGKVVKSDAARFYYRVKDVSRMTKISRGQRYRLLAYIYYKHSELYESFINDESKRLSIDFPYSFWLSAKIYFKDDLQRKARLKKYYTFKLRKELSGYGFLQRKKMFFHWFRIGKLDFSLLDVIKK